MSSKIEWPAVGWRALLLGTAAAGIAGVGTLMHCIMHRCLDYKDVAIVVACALIVGLMMRVQKGRQKAANLQQAS